MLRRHLFVRVALAVGAAALLTVAGGASYFAVSNRDRAGRWQKRAEHLEANAQALERVLVTRTRALNVRVRQLNTLAVKLRRTRRALSRSESDVSGLEKRQRELAAEKAQIEDERQELLVQQATLEDVADAYVTCNGGLVDLVDAVANEDWYWVDAYFDGIAADCGQARASLSNYVEIYGSP